MQSIKTTHSQDYNDLLPTEGASSALNRTILKTNSANVVENNNTAVVAHWPCRPAVPSKDTILIRVSHIDPDRSAAHTT